MKLFYLFLFLLSFCFTSRAQTKHSLVVAIGEYPTNITNWSSLSSLNDYDMVTKFLKEQGFADENMRSLLDKEATAANLMKAFDEMIEQLKYGDMVYFHFSGHGQQVADLSPEEAKETKFLKKDENDNLDEALVMYDAPMYWKEGYNMEKHFVDDQIGHYMQKIRRKIGKKGQLLVLLDACHSGTATRGAESITLRGSKQICAPTGISKKDSDKTIGFDADLDITQNADLANLIAFFGCKAEQVNREIKDANGTGYGSLTYYFINAVNELKEGQASYQNLYSKVNEKMIIAFRNEQHPVVEADELNTLVFNGGLIVQKPFFNLTKILNNSCTLDGGYLRGLQKGDSIGIYPNTTVDPKDSKSILSGIVTEVNAFTANLVLNIPYEGNTTDGVKFRAFVMNSVNSSAIVKLKINTKSKALKKQFNQYFKDKANISIVEEDFEYQILDTTINNIAHARIYIGNNTTNSLRGMEWKPVHSNAIIDSFSLYLNQSKRTDVFRKLDFESKSAKLDVKLFSCQSNCDSEEPIWDSIPVQGNFQVKEGNKFKIELLNKGSKTIYVNIVDIYPTNEVHWMENPEMGKSYRNLILKEGMQKSENLIVSVGPPYGMEQFKLIVTDRPIDLAQLEENGSSLAKRGGDNHPLLNFVDAKLSGTRGGTVSAELGASAYNVFFEILKN
jgi:hypothetical protein